MRVPGYTVPSRHNLQRRIHNRLIGGMTPQHSHSFILHFSLCLFFFCPHSFILLFFPSLSFVLFFLLFSLRLSFHSIHSFSFSVLFVFLFPTFIHCSLFTPSFFCPFLFFSFLSVCFFFPHYFFFSDVFVFVLSTFILLFSSCLSLHSFFNRLCLIVLVEITKLSTSNRKA